MRRALLLLPLSWLAGCRGETQYEIVPYPDLVFSTDRIEFGEVAAGETASQIVYIENAGGLRMGIQDIFIGQDGWEKNFDRIEPQAKQISCPSGELAKDEVAADTGAASAAEGDTEGELIVLGPGCRLPLTVVFNPEEVGELNGSLHVITYEEDVESGQPGFYADPHNYKGVVLLNGQGLRGSGKIQLEPRNVNFGHVWAGGLITKQVVVRNIGDGDLSLKDDPWIDPKCTAAADFSIGLDYYDLDRILPPGDATLLEVSFHPSAEGGVECSMYVPSSDAEDDPAEVTLLGNRGIDPDNQPPVVELLSPDPGYVHQSADPLQLRLHIFDANQPADTLTCRVRSLLKASASIADCTPADEKGYVIVDIDTDDLEEGADALLVEVTDQGQMQSWASTTVLWSGQAADSDDDGDGFGEEPDPEVDPTIDTVDCDDTDITTYPGGAEIDDGKDNDCDGAVDEYTVGGDDDGDSVSELDGDCDDTSDVTYPGAPEWPDQMDNDCDGIIDEDTANYDSDNDGFTLDDGDCNDNNAEISPTAVEYCDGFDNDCDGAPDYSDSGGCVPVAFPPSIIGGCLLEDRALVVGQSTTATVYVYDPDTAELGYDWQPDYDFLALSHDPIAPNRYVQTITWTAPSHLADGKSKETFSVALVVDDSVTGSDYCYDEVIVYAEEEGLVDAQKVTAEAGGCGDDGGEAAAGLLAPLLALFGWRRRRGSAESA